MTVKTFKRRWFAVGIVLAVVLALGAPLVSAQDGTAPRTITDFMGRSVTIETPPQHVVGMSASINEMLFAIGVTPAGVTEGMDYPAEAASLPTFGTGYQPDLEALAALEPDLIVANVQLNAQFMDKLEAIAPTIAILTVFPADVPANIRLLGQATWPDTQADFLATSYEDFLTLTAALGSGQEGPSILIIVGTLDVPNYGKSETYLGNMAQLLGATNVADGEADAGPFPGYAQLSIEKILDADPDFIFTVTRGADVPMAETMKTDDVWSALSAVQNGSVYELDSRLFVEAPGPRFVEGILQLYDIFYGEGM